MEQKMLEEFCEYAKIDGEDKLAVNLYLAAVELAEAETGKVFKIENNIPKYPLYWLAIKMMVAHWYDNRGNGSEKGFSELPMSAQTILNHIALSSFFEEVKK